MSRDPDDAGQVLLLILVYALIAVALTTVVASASAVHLERKRLLALADATALDAADQLDERLFYTRGASPGAGLPLTDASVRASADAYVRLSGARTRFRDFAVHPATGTTDGRTASVTLVARAEPPLLSSVISAFADGIPLQVNAQARTRLQG